MDKRIDLESETPAFCHTLERAKVEDVYFTPMLELYKRGKRIASGLCRPIGPKDNQNALIFELFLMVPVLEPDEILFAADSYVAFASAANGKMDLVDWHKKKKLEALYIYHNHIDDMGPGSIRNLCYLRDKNNNITWVDHDQRGWTASNMTHVAMTTKLFFRTIRDQDFPFDRDFILSILRLGGHSVWLENGIQLLGM